jgi:hypothetical protein
MTDAETSAAIEALVHRVKLRDQAIRAGEDCPDAEPFALEFLTALRGRGWRPTPARVYAAPKAAEPGSAPPLRPETADLLRDLHADMEARAARDRAAKEAPREEGAA